MDDRTADWTADDQATRDPAPAPEAGDRLDAGTGQGLGLAFLAVVTLLVLSAAGGGTLVLARYTGGSVAPSESAAGTAPAAATAALGEARLANVPAKSYYYELPDLLVSLETGGETPALLKISAALEVGDEATLERLDRAMPRVLDSFQVYLSALDIEDLSGDAGLHRFSEELLLRVNASIRPAEVRYLRFAEILVQ